MRAPCRGAAPALCCAFPWEISPRAYRAGFIAPSPRCQPPPVPVIHLDGGIRAAREEASAGQRRGFLPCLPRPVSPQPPGSVAAGIASALLVPRGPSCSWTAAARLCPLPPLLLRAVCTRGWRAERGEVSGGGWVREGSRCCAGWEPVLSLGGGGVLAALCWSCRLLWGSPEQHWRPQCQEEPPSCSRLQRARFPPPMHHETWRCQEGAGWGEGPEDAPGTIHREAPRSVPSSRGGFWVPAAAQTLLAWGKSRPCSVTVPPCSVPLSLRPPPALLQPGGGGARLFLALPPRM